MREIKFRAWSIREDGDGAKFGRIINLFDLFRDSKLMAKMKLHELAYASTDESILGKGDITPMQFTGLLDKNGKEIYEGDIIQFTTYIGEIVRGKVYFENCSFKVDIEFNEQIECFDLGDNERVSEIDVIGNIYENKELLK